ncbi:hypothetical protein TRIUR3_28916 [Triticum urartu]|uniref:Uncharacterized protein n=1 Tax=Triticum urartu TaxID=4572 RepID=M7Z204_TRIUA|nr:hypothetical protein TRIUR3_28916 [Triticum urartu]
MAFAASRRLSAAAAAPKLSSLFTPRPIPNPKPRPLSPESGDDPRRRKARPRSRHPWGEDAAALLRRLHEGRYLPGPYIPDAPHVVSPDAVKAAAERFGNDHQVVANRRWLSGSDLKKVALFGCPSVERRTVFASKRLRAFFNLPEEKVCNFQFGSFSRRICSQRMLEISLLHVVLFQEVPRYDKVILSDTMRILALFVLDAYPEPLQVTAEVKASVRKLLKDTINLSI